ncbi:MAG: hypothetical protein AAF939_07500 [Planctomycetota bacterium]
MTSLKEKIDEIKAAFSTKAPDAAKKIMHDATEALKNSGKVEAAIQVGSKIPSFELKDSEGNLVTSQQLLNSGTLVLSFFRGHW